MKSGRPEKNGADEVLQTALSLTMATVIVRCMCVMVLLIQATFHNHGLSSSLLVKSGALDVDLSIHESLGQYIHHEQTLTASSTTGKRPLGTG